MGRDRTSVIHLDNGFIIGVDKDHLGFYKGKQKVIKQNGLFVYRGWHYHVKHDNYSQEQIYNILEQQLVRLGATKEEKNIKELGIGTVEHIPSKFCYYKQDDRTCVLWISSFNGDLHIEANKREAYQRGIFTKAILEEFFKNGIKE